MTYLSESNVDQMPSDSDESTGDGVLSRPNPTIGRITREVKCSRANVTRTQLIVRLKGRSVFIGARVVS